MKHLSSWLTVLLLGAVPLSAAALDYGPNRPLLAAENGAPPLPAAHATSRDPVPKPYMADIDADTADAGPAIPRIAPVASPGVPRVGQAPSASNKPRTRIAKPATAPTPASWQSLLPGSIQ